MARLRRGDRQSRRSGGARAGERQGARARHGAGRRRRGPAARARARRRRREESHGGEDHREGRRRERTAGQRGGEMRRRAFLGRVLALAGGGAASACGYSLAGRGSFLPPYIQTIGVPTFTNRTNVFNLETLLTQKVRAEFIGRGKYQILPQANNVDGLLNGEVSAVTITPVG